MKLRPSRGHMFKSVDYTCTYYQGCDHNCLFCWTLFQRGPISHKPRLMQYNEHQILKERDAVIFPNSAHDSFALCIPTDWIMQMLRWMGRQHPSLEFYIQSQAIERAFNEPVIFRKLLELNHRVIIGTTLQTNIQGIVSRFSDAPSIMSRYKAMLKFRDHRFRLRLSLEPLFKFDYIKLRDMVLKISSELVEVGLDNYTRRHGLRIPQPDYESYNFLKEDLEDAGIKVCEKRSIERWREWEMRQG